MEIDRIPAGPFKHRIVGEEIQAGGRIVQPVSEVKGRAFHFGKEQGKASAISISMTPVELLVHNGAEEYTVDLQRSTQKSVRSIIAASLLLSATCLTTSILATLLAKRKLLRD